ncbi:MAG: peptidoglycan DD-metalloendopeptidase family protein [Betaproteobacteria bacterium]|nr:peptidoglycan DD-metalloendopeptidase family protein [Betaproteobacteria bacterium]
MRTRKRKILAELRWRLEGLRWFLTRFFGQIGKKKIKRYPSGLRWHVNELRWRLAGPNRARRVKTSGFSENIAELPWRLLGNKRGLIAGSLVGISVLGVAAATAVVMPEEPVGMQTIVEKLSVLPEVISSPGLPYVYDDYVGSGDTVQSIFRRLDISDPDALAFLQKNPEAVRAIQQLRSGNSFTIVVDPSGHLLSMRLPATSIGNSVEISRNADNQPFRVSNTPITLESGTEMRRGVITNSLFAATEAAGLPDSIATQLTDLFGTEIDFHTDLRPGDTFSVIYQTTYDRGAPAQAGRILAAEFINQGVRYTVFLHTSVNGHSEYYKSTGQSLRSSFLRSPLEFSRVTSTFGRRVHPVLGSWHNHSGVDFGAPVGTPVRATSDGEVVFIGRYGGYGKFIVLKHRDNISTAYAHLNAFAPGLSVGETVRQGEIIGEVGATGRVTAPHLHYEFRINDIAQNPMTAVLPNSEPLRGNELARFRENTRLQLARLELLNHHIAANEHEDAIKAGKM